MEQTEKLSLAAAAEIMRPFSVEGSRLADFVDTTNENFCDYRISQTNRNA